MSITLIEVYFNDNYVGKFIIISVMVMIIDVQNISRVTYKMYVFISEDFVSTGYCYLVIGNW